MPFFENSGAGSSVDALLLIGLCLMSGFDSSRKRHHGRQTTRQVLVVIEFVRSLAVDFRWSGTPVRPFCHESCGDPVRHLPRGSPLVSVNYHTIQGQPNPTRSEPSESWPREPAPSGQSFSPRIK